MVLFHPASSGTYTCLYKCVGGVVAWVQIRLTDDRSRTSNDSSWRTGKWCIKRSVASWRPLASQLLAHSCQSIVQNCQRRRCLVVVPSKGRCSLPVHASRHLSQLMLTGHWWRLAASAPDNRSIMTVSCLSLASNICQSVLHCCRCIVLGTGLLYYVSIPKLQWAGKPVTLTSSYVPSLFCTFLNLTQI